MLLFEFKCSSCRLRFEEWTSREAASSGISCPSCKASSPRHYGSVNFSFKGGKPTENNIDLLIGREAEKRWEVVNAQKVERDKIRKDANENFLVSPMEGVYRASTPTEKESNRQILNTYEKQTSRSED